MTPDVLVFPSARHFTFDMCGKFKAPDDAYIHMTRELTNFELMIVTRGVLYIADGSRRYAVREGEYLLMAPTASQYGYQKGACSFYWMHFLPYSENEQTPSFFRLDSQTEPDTAGRFPVQTAALIPVYDRLSIPERVVVLLRQLQDTALRYHNGCLNDSLTTAVLNEIRCQSSIYQKYASPFQTHQIYQDIVDYIHYHANGTLRVSELAEQFGYSGKYLSEFFKKHAGVSLKQYILKRKMENAAAELSESNRSVSEIAWLVGFEDVHNFSNAFKRITGLSPKQYRESFGNRKTNYE